MCLHLHYMYSLSYGGWRTWDFPLLSSSFPPLRFADFCYILVLFSYLATSKIIETLMYLQCELPCYLHVGACMCSGLKLWDVTVLCKQELESCSILNPWISWDVRLLAFYIAWTMTTVLYLNMRSCKSRDWILHVASTDCYILFSLF